MDLITRQGKGSKLTVQEMDGNLEYLESIGRPYKVYTALLTQTTYTAASSTEGFLVEGHEYKILTLEEGDDFSNLTEGDTFTYEDEEPADWSNGSEVIDLTSSSPVATVLENTLGFTPSFSYSRVGLYIINSPENYPMGKTACFISPSNSNFNGNVYLNQFSQSVFYINSLDTDNLEKNDMLANTTIEIRVYN